MENYVSYTDTLLQTGLRPCVCAKIVTCLRLYTYESVFINRLSAPIYNLCKKKKVLVFSTNCR